MMAGELIEFETETLAQAQRRFVLAISYEFDLRAWSVPGVIGALEVLPANRFEMCYQRTPWRISVLRIVYDGREYIYARGECGVHLPKVERIATVMHLLGVLWPGPLNVTARWFTTDRYDVHVILPPALKPLPAVHEN